MSLKFFHETINTSHIFYLWGEFESNLRECQQKAASPYLRLIFASIDDQWDQLVKYPGKESQRFEDTKHTYD